MSQKKLKCTLPGRNHILYDSARDIRAISAPLEEHFSITEFTYERIYHNNYKIKLTNQPEWLFHFYEQGFYLFGDQTIDTLGPGVHLTTNMNNSEPIFNCSKRVFNIGEGILLIDFFEDYRELFWFTASHLSSIDYFNNIELLRMFTRYFKVQAAPIIKRAESQKILRPYHPGVDTLALAPQHANANAFLQRIKSNKYIFHDHTVDVTLTRKELACAVGLIGGKSAKGIAFDLSRSTRTVEKHIDRIKAKVSCYSKPELIEYLLHLGVGLYLNKPF